MNSYQKKKNNDIINSKITDMTVIVIENNNNDDKKRWWRRRASALGRRSQEPTHAIRDGMPEAVCHPKQCGNTTFTYHDPIPSITYSLVGICDGRAVKMGRTTTLGS